MIARLRCVFGSSSDKNLPIISLDTAEPNGNVELLKELLSRTPIVIYVVISYNLLVKLEEMNSVYLTLTRVSHSHQIVLVC